MARRRFFVDEVRTGRAQIHGDDAHHLTRVLRVEVGQRYEISDNTNVYLAEIESARKDLVSFSIIEKLAAPEPLVLITIVAAIIKFDRFEWLVEKATELGVDRIVPFAAERTEKGLDRAVAKRTERWRKIAREASEQSRRPRLPEIGDPLRFSAAAAMDAAVRLMLEEESGAQPILSMMPGNREVGSSVAIMVGPEGGWTDHERARLNEAGWLPVSLGATILRAETAAIAAVSIVQAAWAG